MDKKIKIFKSLGEPTRLKILKLLTVRPMYVCELEAILNISQPRISQHLRVLKEAGLVKENKQAQRTFYNFDVNMLEKELKEFVVFLRTGINDLPSFAQEAQALEQLSCNEQVARCKSGVECDN